MRMTTKTIWIAFDGKEFDTEKECAEYESNNYLLKKAREALKNLTDFCNNEVGDCGSCPLSRICHVISDNFGDFNGFEDLIGRNRE